MQEIPLSCGAVNSHQNFITKINNVSLTFDINYCGYVDTPFWSMSISQDGTVLAQGITLVPGCDVLQNYDAGIGRLVFVGEEATLDNLGVDNHLVWVAE